MESYIVAGYRSAVGKSKKGGFRFFRPDDLGAQVVKRLMDDFPNLDKDRISDVICGNATPEAEQGLNIGRMISLMGLDTVKVPGMTINRYCSSGLESIALATAKIKAGMGDCIIAGGVECMSPIPFGGWKVIPNYEVAKNKPEWYWGMGLTAEQVANDYSISREDQDKFAINSYNRSKSSWESGKFNNEIIPVEIPQRRGEAIIMDKDEEFSNVNIKKIPNLRPVFQKEGSVTAANASTLNDGAAALILMSETKMKELNLTPIAEILSYADAAQEPEWFTTAPAKAVPIAIKKAGLKKENINFYELNEAFSVVGIANSKILNVTPEQVNVIGGAVSLGHPLGCSGARIIVTLINVLKQRNGQYGAAGICNGGGGASAVVIKSC